MVPLMGDTSALLFVQSYLVMSPCLSSPHESLLSHLLNYVQIALAIQMWGAPTVIVHVRTEGLLIHPLEKGVMVPYTLRAASKECCVSGYTKMGMSIMLC